MCDSSDGDGHFGSFELRSSCPKCPTLNGHSDRFNARPSAPGYPCAARSPPQILIQGGDDLSQTSALIASRQLFNPSFEPSHGLWGNFTSIDGFPSRKAEPQETTVLGAIHGALALIHPQFEATRVSTCTELNSYPFSGASSSNATFVVLRSKAYKNKFVQALMTAVFNTAQRA
jgi:hypothetical protein